MFSSFFEKRGQHIGGGNLTSTDDFWYNAIGAPTSSGAQVNKHSAMRLYSVYACVSLIAETLAQFPLKLKRKLPNGDTEDATDHPLYDLLKLQPNPEMTSFTWRETGQAHILLDGNKYTFIERSRLGIKALWPLRPERVTIKRVKNHGVDDFFELAGRKNKIVYEIYNTTKGKITIPARDMLHVPGLGYNGIRGESVITNFARNSIGNGISLDEFEGNFFKNGVYNSLILEHPETLGDQKESFLKALTKRFTGRGNHARPMVLENNMTANQVKISLADQQFIELQKLSAIVICGIFKVPPQKVSIHGKNTNNKNSEEQNSSFIKTTMLPWIVRDEQAMDVKLLTTEERKSGLFTKYNFDAQLRPDAQARSEIRWRNFQMGIPINTMLNRDDENSIPGGDQGFVPLNVIPISDAGFQAENDTTPTGRDICNCGLEHRNIEPVQPTVVAFREKQERSIAGQTRILKRFEPLIRKAADKLVKKESEAVANEAKRNTKNRAKRDFNVWMNEFYNKWPEDVRSEMGPILRAYMEEQREVITAEVGKEFTDAEFNAMTEDYINGFSDQWVDSSRGQLVLMLDEITDDFTPIIERSEEWNETRGVKVEKEQKNGAMNAVAYFAFGAAGFGSVWSLRGTETCPYCTSLEGKRVAPAGIFLNGGTELKPGGDNPPFKVKSLTRYPPMHGGCDCFIRPG